MAASAMAPTHVFIAAGVGTWTATAVRYFQTRFAERCPLLVCVEPVEADAVMESIRQGSLSSSRGNQRTVMAGLNCATPALHALPVLASGCHYFLAIGDGFVKEAVKYLNNNVYFPGLESGESGAAGMAGLLAACANQRIRELFGIRADSQVLFVNTEGITDARLTAALLARQ